MGGPEYSAGHPGRAAPWLAVVCLIALCAPVFVVAAEIDDFIGIPVVEVALLSDGLPVRDESVLELVETKVGSPLSMRQVRESVTHLFSLGRFESVEVAGHLLRGGVTLQYVLVPLQLIERVEIEGDVGVRARDVRRAISESHGPSFRAGQSDAIADTLRRFYRDRGFLTAQVHTRVEGVGPGRLIRIQVQAGERARIERLVVRGVSATMYPMILSRLGLEAGSPYDGLDIDRRLSDYEGELRRARYYEADLAHDIEIVAGGTRVHLLLDIQQGRRITIELAGDEVPGVDRAALVPLEREGSVDEDLLEDSDRRITALLGDLGYRDATVAHTRETAGDELSIVFTVDRGRLYQIDQVVFTSNQAVPEATLAPLMNLTPGDPLVMRELESGLASVAEHYRQLGYATVRVEPHVAESSPGRQGGGESVLVTCRIDVDEGVRTVVRSVVVQGNEFLSDEALGSTISSTVDGPYYAQRVAVDRGSIRRLYLNAGYERVVVDVEPRFDEELEAVDLVYRITEGPQTIIEHALIVGNEQVDSATIRRELALQEGRPLGLADVAETRRRLNALGMFRRIDIREFSHGGGNLRDVVVVVEEAPATRLGYGGGLEVSQRLRRKTGAASSQAVEQIEFAPRGFVELGRRNLWGKNRSIDLFSRVSVRRKNDPANPVQPAGGSGFGFNEYRILATYREPRTFGLLWDIFVTGFIEQAIRPGFDLFSRGVNAEIRRQLTPTVNASVSYGWGQNNTSNKVLDPEDEPLVDRLFPEVRLSSFSGSLLRDTRDDVVDPTGGEVLSVDAEVAARAIGSEVGFAKTYMQAFMYRTLPGTSRVVFAAGARVGLAVAFSQFDLVSPPADGGMGLESTLPISERFFAGGDATVRGFAFDRLGLPAGTPGATINADGFPQGGDAVIILNGELRVPVTHNLGVVGFLDAGNVYDRVSNVDLGRIRGGVGFGVRYRSPVGPIRVDLGFKLDRQEFGSGQQKQKEQLTALHISIGQAF